MIERKQTDIDCRTMNYVYELLKTMTIAQIENARDVESYIQFPNNDLEREFFRQQCDFAIHKKCAGKW
jgi:hypothetical protein